MAEAQLQQFLEKVRQLNAFVALSESQPALRDALRACDQHHEVVALAAQHGFDIGRRWGDSQAAPAQPKERPSDQINLFSSLCPAAGEERVDRLIEGPGWRLERIHSCLASSPEGFWYDQTETEWVLVLRGSAQLRFEDEQHSRDLCVGDSLLIDPHRRHRVVTTDPDPGTLWLALFCSADA
ncbi:MAG: Nif11 domain/cupin domain-containing protein [Vulcanococcus sp.]|jgi:cupin 2 domain-containing protein|uniref:Nif11 domain/cupin domain-containing protein n=1 Tax=Vulcanococcus sp. TaxID=2856995 RepID=UPI0025FD4938|nr:Nif11 domain/cupin domain-containing protein [Vulcanococcus sp.]MBW0173477.1 Nif11 domain/cupin domain-containing protein [Vulcanococcus sp.]MBW0180217.1 Nif11 domain/cupin domain-containing protein [Vulcanococcus sp.]